MKRKQSSEEQVIGILKEAEAGMVVTELHRKAPAVARRGDRPAQAAAGGLDARQRGSERSAVKKLVAPAAKRQAVAPLQTTLGMSERRACMVVGADRTSMRYGSCRADDRELRSRLCELARQRRRFGYRRLHILLLRLVVDMPFSDRRVVRELTDLIAERGRLKMIVSHNGIELTSNAALA